MDSQANIQLDVQLNSVSCAPGLGKQPSRGEVAPAHSQYSLTWLPNSHKTLFSFSTEPWREARETPHTARAQLPAASVALIMCSYDLLRAGDAAVSCYAPHEPLARSGRTETICWEETIIFFHFTMEDSRLRG